MAIHDWTRVDAGIFHAFRHSWVSDLASALNRRVLPNEYYALVEHHAVGSGPDKVAAEGSDEAGAAGLLLAEPKLKVTAETDMEFYHRKQNVIAVRHVSGDRVVAFIEIISPGNKSTRTAFRSLIEKAAELLERRIHLLMIDLLPPGPRDPHGLHAALWDEIAGNEPALPAGKSLTVAAYETALTVRAYVQNLAVGDVLPEMPLFLEPNACVTAPLEATYNAAFDAIPGRWRRVIAAG